MRINFDRICELAGTSAKGSSRKFTRRALNEAQHHDEGMYEADDADEGADHMMEDDDADEGMEEDQMVEVDVSELMSEVRRAKRLMKESRQRAHRRKLAESRRREDHLKQIIASEVENILSEIDERDSGWVYGKRQPRHSRKGYTNHGRTLPGIGFKNNW
jgi:hypothetical protein